MLNTRKIIITLMFATALCGCSKTQENTAQQSTNESVAEAEAASQQDTNVSAGLANPWVYSDEAGVLEATGFDIKAPSGAEDINYSYEASQKLAQLTYRLDGAEWVYRIKPTTEPEDISGMYYDDAYSEEGTVDGKPALYMAYSDAKEGEEFIDDVFSVQIVNWFDDANGVSYSLSASGNDLNGMDIQVYAENIYEPL